MVFTIQSLLYCCVRNSRGIWLSIFNGFLKMTTLGEDARFMPNSKITVLTVV